jgi:hypothetical protein
MLLSSNEKVLTCFYQNGDIKQIIAKSFSIDVSNPHSNPSFQEISNLIATKDNNGAKVIKSILSKDGKKSFVCFINDDNNGECLIYDITENTWSELPTYLSDCLPEITSLNIEYFENAGENGEYVLYCFQSQTKLNLVKFDSNFNKIVEDNEIYDINENEAFCPNFAVSTLAHNSINNLNIFIVCDDTIKKVGLEKYEPTGTTIPTTIPKTTIPATIPKTTIPIIPKTTIPTTIPKTKIIPTTIPKATTIPTTIPKTTIPTTITKTTISRTTISSKKAQTTILEKIFEMTSTLPLSHPSIKTTIKKTIIINHSTNIIDSNNKTELIIIHDKSNKTKEEIIDNLDTVMKEYDLGKIYEIFGDDYNVKISPINVKQHDQIATYIDFNTCENILRQSNKLNQTSLLTVYQIEIFNTHEQTLVNNVEYAVYNLYIFK